MYNVFREVYRRADGNRSRLELEGARMQDIELHLRESHSFIVFSLYLPIPYRQRPNIMSANTTKSELNVSKPKLTPEELYEKKRAQCLLNAQNRKKKKGNKKNKGTGKRKAEETLEGPEVSVDLMCCMLLMSALMIYAI